MAEAQRPIGGVTPYVNVEGAANAAEFYKTAFGATELLRMPADDGKRLIHCHLSINGGDLMLSDVFPEYGYDHQPSHSFTMHLQVADPQAWFDKAVAAGCEVKMPMDVQFWGDRYGSVKDPFGVHWSIGGAA